MVRIVIIVLLAALQVCFGAPEFLLGNAPYWQRCLTYSFFHANWIHLAVNSIALWALYKNPCKPCRDFVFPFLIAIMVYPLSFRPVIGFSNVLYAAIGLRTPSLRSRWWRQTPVIIFLAVTLALLFIPRFSSTTHIAAFLIGMLFAAIGRFIQSINKDARRYY